MGIIYLFTSPSGKKYVGQTRSEFKHRMGQHKSAARAYAESIEKGERPRAACTYLYNAISKYGWDSFKIEIIYECELEELDYWENFYIEQHDTLAPKGYNLMSGGVTNKVYTPEAIENFKAAAAARVPRVEANHRENPDHKNLPKYLVAYRRGLCIQRHPVCAWKAFEDKDKTYQELLNEALLYLEGLNNGTIVFEKQVRELPEYIEYFGSGYRFLYRPVGQTKGSKSKRFNNALKSQEENLRNAITYRDEFLAKLINNN